MRKQTTPTGPFAGLIQTVQALVARQNAPGVRIVDDKKTQILTVRLLGQRMGRGDVFEGTLQEIYARVREGEWPAHSYPTELAYREEVARRCKMWNEATVPTETRSKFVLGLIRGRFLTILAKDGELTAEGLAYEAERQAMIAGAKGSQQIVDEVRDEEEAASDAPGMRL